MHQYLFSKSHIYVLLKSYPWPNYVKKTQLIFKKIWHLSLVYILDVHLNIQLFASVGFILLVDVMVLLYFLLLLSLF